MKSAPFFSRIVIAPFDRPAKCFAGVFLLTTIAGAAGAQTPPDAGSLLRQQLKTAPSLPAQTTPNLQRDDAAPKQRSDDDSVRFVLTAVRISGNTVFSESELTALLQPMLGKRIGLAGLDAAAARISRHYRSRGYPVARAYLPPQDIVDGSVQIVVIEGRVGGFALDNAANVRDSVANDYLQRRLGAVVSAPQLERMLLLLDDLPGVGGVRAALRPGAHSGESDVVVAMQNEPEYRGSLAVDNYGNRYVGANQFTATFSADSPTRLGDQLTAQITQSDDEMRFGRLSYRLPVGGDGMEIGAGYIASDYGLGGRYATLDADGDSSSYLLNAGYPFVRRSDFSLYGRVVQSWREFEDRSFSSTLIDDKSSRVTALLLHGNAYDNVWGGGGTAFTLAYSHGDLDLDTAAVRAIDDATAHTQGTFSKWNLQLLRMQNFGARASAYFAFVGQQANDNLDSSEKFILGGPQGVRAYPQGEAPGDSGYIGTMEFRYLLLEPGAFGELRTFAFVDSGAITLNEDPFVSGDNHRRLSGCGFGLNWLLADGFSAKLTLARKLGNAPALSGDDQLTRFWGEAAWYF